MAHIWEGWGTLFTFCVVSVIFLGTVISVYKLYLQNSPNNFWSMVINRIVYLAMFCSYKLCEHRILTFRPWGSTGQTLELDSELVGSCLTVLGMESGSHARALLAIQSLLQLHFSLFVLCVLQIRKYLVCCCLISHKLGDSLVFGSLPNSCECWRFHFWAYIEDSFYDVFWSAAISLI